MLLTNWEGNLH